MPNALLADELNQNGHAIPGLKQLDDPIAAQARASIQRRAEQSALGLFGAYSWWFARFDDGSEIAPYWSEQRDRDLRLFVRKEGNDILQGAVSSMVKWGKTLAWLLEGPDRVVRRYQEMLAASEFGEGWGTLISKTLEDYYTQDKGGTVELIGAGEPDGPLEGPVLGLAHLDAQYVQPTADIVYPVLFHNPKDGLSHKLHASRVIRIVDLPSPNELLCGVGWCAVSRVVASSQVLLKLARYKNEKLSDMPEAGLLILNNLLPQKWEDAKAEHQRARRKIGQEIWSNIMTLFSIDPAQPATAELISFANLPDGFNEAESTNLYVNILALAFGIDRQELFPSEAGNLGQGKQSEIMNQKSKGKGKGDIIAAIERAINWRVLPPSVNFRFDFRDDEEDRLKAEINDLRSKTIWGLWDSEAYRAGLETPVSIMEIRQMLAENVEYFRQEFLEVSVDDEEELTDTDREDDKMLRPEFIEGFGDMVMVDSQGAATYRRKKGKAQGEVLKMVEENYRAGRIDLDQLIEFKLGTVLDGKLIEAEKSNPCHSSGSGRFCQTGGGGGSASGGEDTSPDTWSKRISAKEEDAIITYTGSRYQEINSGLRNGDLSKEDAKIVKDMDSAIAKSRLAEDTTMYENQKLYRAADIPEVNRAIESGNIEGLQFTDKGFVSTTTDKEIAQNFQRTPGSRLFVINAPAGTNAANVSSLGHGLEKENEWLLPRNTNFKVAKVEKSKEKVPYRDLQGKVKYRTQTVEYVHLDVVGGGGEKQNPCHSSSGRFCRTSGGGGDGGGLFAVSLENDAGIAGANVEDSTMRWSSEDTIKGQVTLSHSAEAKPTKEQLNNLMQNNAHNFVGHLDGPEDIEDVKITDISHGNGVTIFKVDMTPTVEAGERWASEADVGRLI